LGRIVVTNFVQKAGISIKNVEVSARRTYKRPCPMFITGLTGEPAMAELIMDLDQNFSLAVKWQF